MLDPLEGLLTWPAVVGAGLARPGSAGRSSRLVIGTMFAARCDVADKAHRGWNRLDLAAVDASATLAQPGSPPT